jgi:hypothetical protein
MASSCEHGGVSLGSMKKAGWLFENLSYNFSKVVVHCGVGLPTIPVVQFCIILHSLNSE